jgi:phosphohistidine phosphatase
MKIYIMRHGQAGMNAKTDEQRPLTEQGIEESIHMAGWLAPQLAGS